jgi:DNA-binding LytR/AlgR family response regulator
VTRTSVTRPGATSGRCVLVVAVGVKDRLLHEAEVDVVFVDIALPGLDGIGLAKVLGRFARQPAVFVADDPDWAVEAFELGAVDYLRRPVGAERLAESLRRVGARQALRACW